MEKNDLTDIFEIFKLELRDDIFSKRFFKGLISNIWYSKSKNTIYYGDIRDICNQIIDWRRKWYLKNETWADYYLFKGSFGSISNLLKESKAYKDFIIKEYNQENLNYFRSLQRDKKIKNILKDEKLSN